MADLHSWKKAYYSDIEGIIHEMKDTLKTPMVMMLSGDLGTGKTTFVKKFVEVVLGTKDAINSPTYSILSEWGNVVHGDFYRLQGPEEIEHLELGLYVENAKYFFVEWGIDHLPRLRRELGQNFNYYHLMIELGPKLHGELEPSRNYILKSLEC